MGKKYIIEIPEDKIADFVGVTHFLMPYMMAGHIGYHDTGLPIKPYTAPDIEHVRKEAYDKGYHDGHNACYETAKDLMEKKKNEAYKRGLVDAWDAARKISTIPVKELKKILDIEEDDNGMLWPLHEYTASEAIEKIKQYEQEQEETSVGDEVTDGYHNACVLFENPDGTQAMVLKQDGTTAWWHKSAYRTGRHFPEIAAVLEKMRGEDDLK